MIDQRTYLCLFGKRGVIFESTSMGRASLKRHGLLFVASLTLLPFLPFRAVSAQTSVSAPASGAVPAQSQSANAGQPAPLTLTLHDAIERAQKNDVLFLSAATDAALAREDRTQARAALLPSLGLRSEFLGTQGDTPIRTGRFVTQDGIHVYREWGVARQDLSPVTLTQAAYRRAAATAAAARARQEIALRGVRVTATQAYYALVNAERKYATAQQARDQAQHVLGISQDMERGGEVAHSDVIKFQIQANDAARAFQEASLAMENARLALAVLLFPNFDQNFNVVDDLNLAPALPPFTDVQAMTERDNPDIRAAMETFRAANFDVSAARQAFLPALSVELDYGIEANAVALHSFNLGKENGIKYPNLGYLFTATATVPVWDWGALRSKLKQAKLRQQLARVQLSAAQRQLLSNLYGFYGEANTARRELDTLRQSADLATEGLRLSTLRYQAGEATVLEVVDAETVLTAARNAYDDGAVRYRVALANLQTLTGNF